MSSKGATGKKERGVELPLETDEDDGTIWEEDDLLVDPQEILELEDEVEATIAEDDLDDDEDLLEDDTAPGPDTRWDEKTIDADDSYEDVGDWDDLLESEDETPLPPLPDDEPDEDEDTDPSWSSLSPPLLPPAPEELPPRVVSWRPIVRLALHDGLRINAIADLAEARSYLYGHWSDGETGHVELQLETGPLKLVRGQAQDSVVLSLDIEGRRVDAVLNLLATDGPTRLVLGRSLLAQHRFLVDPA